MRRTGPSAFTAAGRCTIRSGRFCPTANTPIPTPRPLLVGRELTGYRHYLRLEAEGQLVKHFDLMNHFEVNALVVLRWLPFPWDRYLDTSFAVGEGLSYATRDPAIEVEKHGRTSQLLNYLLFELAFCLPQHPRWDYFLRVHHRSGVFGLFDGVSGGSNLVGAGFRYRF